MMTTVSGARSAVLPRVLVLLGLLGVVASHGYLLEPPQRSSMWRVGFDTPVNYNDMELNCGGKQVSSCNQPVFVVGVVFLEFKGVLPSSLDLE